MQRYRGRLFDGAALILDGVTIEVHDKGTPDAAQLEGVILMPPVEGAQIIPPAHAFRLELDNGVSFMIDIGVSDLSKTPIEGRFVSNGPFPDPDTWK
jgi:hypothetical protein